MRFKTLVINIESSKKRLESIKQQCSNLELKFEKVSGIQGGLLTEEEKKQKYDICNNKNHYYKLLNDGEIGCYLSHAKCWQKIVDDSLDFALVLEDDAVLTPEIVLFINAVEKLTLDWDYIKLSHGSKSKQIKNKVTIGDGLFLGECAKLPSTCTGQFISNAGAKKLLASATPIKRPVDVDIQHWFEKQLKCFVVRPFPVVNGNFDSEINKTGNRRNIKGQKLKRIFHKIAFEVNLLLNKQSQGKSA